MAKRQVSDSQKKAMARGRANSRVVKEYLEALERNRPRRGRKRTPAGIRKRLDAIANEMDDATQLAKLDMVQERINLEAELDQLLAVEDITDKQKAFVSIANEYSESRGISWAAWREMGVPSEVLREAGLTRSN
jgi:hypothetical protein